MFSFEDKEDCRCSVWSLHQTVATLAGNEALSSYFPSAQEDKLFVREEQTL